MKKLIITSLCVLVRIGIPLFIIAAQCASAAPPKEKVREMILDEHNVYTIPVGVENVTTISFPGPITALDGALLTTDGKTFGKFQIAYHPGNSFFSARCLVKGQTTNLNVVWNRKTYVLELVQCTEPLLSVIFKEEQEKSGGTGSVAVTPTRLLGMLDKAKAYPLLQEHHPEAVENLMRMEPKNVMEYPGCAVVIDEVFRFDREDTLVFRVTLKSRTDHAVYYDPQGFGIRVGDRIYEQSISDASGVLPANGESVAYFAITGTPSGGRNELSPKNEFTILLALTQQSEGK